MTPREHQLLGFITGYIKQNSFAPSYEEMRVVMDLKHRGGCHDMVKRLIRQKKLVPIDDLHGTPRNLALAGPLDGFTTAELRSELIRRGAMAA